MRLTSGDSDRHSRSRRLLPLASRCGCGGATGSAGCFTSTSSPHSVIVPIPVARPQSLGRVVGTDRRELDQRLIEARKRTVVAGIADDAGREDQPLVPERLGEDVLRCGERVLVREAEDAEPRLA
jgi:hypothetical protein